MPAGQPDLSLYDLVHLIQEPGVETREFVYPVDRDASSERLGQVPQAFPVGDPEPFEDLVIVCFAAWLKARLNYDPRQHVARRNESLKQLIAACPQTNEAERAREILKP